MTAPATPPAPARPRLTLAPDVRDEPVAAGPRLRLLRHEPEPDSAPPPAPPPAPRPPPAVPVDLRETADLRRRAHQVVCLVLEVLGGRRPPGHLAPHLGPRALRYVRALHGQPALAQPSRLTSLHVSRPSAGAVEVAAVHRVGTRSRVLAARFEGSPDAPAGWRCVTMRLL